MLWMLVTMHNPCYVPRASPIITWGTIFTKRLFSVQGMSQILVTHFLDNLLYKTMTEKLLAVRPEMWREGQKEKKTRKPTEKLFALNARWKKMKQCRKLFLEISQNLQENTCARVSFLIKLQASCIHIEKETLTHMFFCGFWEISKNTF